MRVWHGLAETEGRFGPCALSIGNFDGVHAGHRFLLDRLVQIARAGGWISSVLTFDPHPAKVVAPARAPRRLSTPDERCRWIAEAGIEQVLVLPFDRAFSFLTAEEFVRRVLVANLNTRAVLVGDNFRFGHRQAGDVATLRELGGRLGFLVEPMAALKMRGRVVSSSEIRRQIERGRLALAARLLGRPYALEGEVVKGLGIGSRKTVPTLNLGTHAEMLPASGVYVTRTTDLENGRRWPSVTNVGFRPTFGGDSLSIETFLLEGPGEAPPSRIRVEFLFRLRGERRFPSAEALKAQILKDVGRSKAYFRRRARWAEKPRPV